MFKHIIILNILFATCSAHADFEFYRGVRQMGMGGASIAVVNDETAVLSNPNGLGRLRDNFFTLFDPELNTSMKGLDTILDTTIYNSMIPSNLYRELGSDVGEPYYFKGQLFPSIVLPNFGMGVLGKYEILARRNADGTMDYKYMNDYSVNLGYNMRFWDGRVKLGFAGRLLNRVQYDGNLDPATESLRVGAFANEGMGIAVDTGLTLAAPWAWLPTATVFVRDVGNTSFTFGTGLFRNGHNGIPPMVKQSIDVAVALFPIFANHSRGVLTVEYTGINTSSEVDDVMKRLHIGTEVNMWDAYFFRAGFHQKQWTAGFEYSSGVMQWQMATYAEDVEFGTTVISDRRGIMKLAIRY